jgi:hypothetical protein
MFAVLFWTLWRGEKVILQLIIELRFLGRLTRTLVAVLTDTNDYNDDDDVEYCEEKT